MRFCVEKLTQVENYINYSGEKLNLLHGKSAENAQIRKFSSFAVL